MRAYPGHGARNPLHAGLRLTNLRDAASNRRAKQANQDLVDDERSEEVRVLRLCHQLEQARHRIDDAVGRLPHVQPAIVRDPRHPLGVDPLRKLGDASRIQVQLEPEIRFTAAGSSHLRGERQVDGEYQDARRDRTRARHCRASRLWRPGPRRRARGPGWRGRRRWSCARGVWHECPGAGSPNAPSWVYAASRLASRRSANGLGVTRVVSSPSAAADLAKPSARRLGPDCSRCEVRRRRLCR